MGYESKALSTNVKNNIRKRSEMLGMSLEKFLIKREGVLAKTKGELKTVRGNYQSYRSAIRKSAYIIFFNSNKEKKCAICGYNKHIEVAHIKAVSDFSDDCSIAEINSIYNLIALCPNHHWEYDNGILKL